MQLKAEGKRPATTPVTDEGEAKRLRSVIDETAEEFVCALTYELPLDPVTAEDGKIYERAAIEEWLKKHKKSPITNEKMGTKLLPAHAVKNMMEKLVRSGAISGGKAEAWQRRVKEQDAVRELTRKAEGGDTEAMLELAYAYLDGRLGLVADKTASSKWFLRGAEAGNADCMFFAASKYEDDAEPYMLMYWLMSATQTDPPSLGSLVSMLFLGEAFVPEETRPQGFRKVADGWFVPSAAHATKWFRKALPLMKTLNGWFSPGPAREPQAEDGEREAKHVRLVEAWLRDHGTDNNNTIPSDRGAASGGSSPAPSEPDVSDGE